MKLSERDRINPTWIIVNSAAGKRYFSGSYSGAFQWSSHQVDAIDFTSQKQLSRALERIREVVSWTVATELAGYDESGRPLKVEN